jgi:hypothetical protein
MPTCHDVGMSRRPIDIENDLVAAVGRVAIVASRMEVLAAGAYAALIGGEAGPLLAVGQGWATLYTNSIALLDAMVPTKTAKQLRLTFKQANNAWADRNNIVHGFWVAAPDHGEERIAVLIRRFDNRLPKSWSVAKLGDVSDELSRLGSEFHQMTSLLGMRDERQFLSALKAESSEL